MISPPPASQYKYTQTHTDTDTDTKANTHKMCVKGYKEFSNGIKAAWDPCVLLQKTLGLALDTLLTGGT